MSGLPAGWVGLPFGETVQIQKGKKPSDLGGKNTLRTIPYVNIAAFEKKHIAEYAPVQNVPYCNETDTLLVWDGARAGLAGRGLAGYIGSTLSKISSDLITPELLFYFVSSKYDELNSRTKGVGIPHIDPTVFNGLKFSLAPAAEQTRIVAKLDALLTELDAGVAQLKAAQKKLVQYRQSLLKAAVEGTLTAAWRAAQAQQAKLSSEAAETGGQLLERILTERRSRWQAKQLAKYAAQGKPPPKDWQSKYPEPVKPDTSALPALPQGWVWASVDQLAEVFLGKMLDKSKHTSGKKLPYLRNINVRWGEIETSDVSTMFFEDGEIDRYSLKAGDVLVCEGGEPGRAAICNNNHEAFMYQKALHRVRTFGFYAPELLVAYLEFVTKSGGLDKVFTGSTINHFTKECFVVLQIPLPPLREQKIIIDSLTDSLASLETQTTAISFSLKQSAAQRKNILKAAFAGELVPQDPLDEPASALLARIVAQRAAQQLANASAKPAKPRRKGAL
jgi:type I restriction enzyme, S subunit